MSRVAVVLPQIFHVAFELFNRSKNQTFCSAPSTVCGGRAFHTLGISTLPSTERIVAADFRCCIRAQNRESPSPAAGSSPESLRSRAPLLPPIPSALPNDSCADL